MRYRSLFLSILLASAVCAADEVPTGEPLANAASVKPAQDEAAAQTEPVQAKPAQGTPASQGKSDGGDKSSCRGKARSSATRSGSPRASTTRGSPSTSRFSCASSRITRSGRIQSEIACFVEDRFVKLKRIEPWTSFIQS